MKQITKQAEPQELIAWKALANENWQPTYDDLRGEEKQAVKQSLMAEQGYLCCYCESRLIDDDSHIEHFQPQNDPRIDPLNYANLLCSCQNRIAKGDPRHCGNLKNGWFDEQLLVSPLENGCEERFAYSGDGLIRPSDQADERARVTIEKLGLDIAKLNDLRKKVIDPFVDVELSETEFRQFVTGYLRQDAQGMFGEFCTTIRHLFGAYATP
jgi:uncharacterized protein (TIGR02646 family)